MATAGIALCIAVFALLPRGASIDFFMVCLILAPMSFFIGTILYNVLKHFEKTNALACYFQLGSATVTTIFYAIGAQAAFGSGGLIDVITASEGVVTTEMAEWYALVLVTFGFLIQLFVFALMPLFKGIVKTFAVTPELVCPDCGPVVEHKDCGDCETPLVKRPKATTKKATPTEPTQVATEEPKPRTRKPKAE